MIDLELCTDSLSGAQTANEFGFKRIELCSALEVGGLTPSIGLISACVKAGKTEVHAMIRPRTGGFSYSLAEIALMQMDIEAAAKVGAKGVVFGCLTNLTKIDLQHNIELVETAKKYGLETTFHRAIDLCTDWELALDQLINIGIDRVLTSGGEKTAIEGHEQITKMTKKVAGSVQIMAGSGVNASNAQLLVSSGIDGLHFTARKTIQTAVKMGFGIDYEEDKQKIQAILASLK